MINWEKNLEQKVFIYELVMHWQRKIYRLTTVVSILSLFTWPE